MPATAPIANIINHIAFVLDASTSMTPHKKDLIKVADGQIEHLARRSKELDQETRISVWTFADPNRIECVVWDKDVLRLPSISSFYTPFGNTAFIDATLQALDHLGETPERYGDHSFLVFVLTDGEENRSVNRPATLKARLAGLKDHWTVAALVPNAMGMREAKQFGFSAGNIEIWNPNSAAGVGEAGDRVRDATENYMQARRAGVRSTRNLFSTGADAVNVQTIAQAGLTPMAKGTYVLVPVPTDSRIDEFTKACGHNYQAGRGFYQLMKREEIQATKDIMVVGKKDHKVYSGRDARQMVGLPDMNVRVSPNHNPDFDIYVQSTSINRKLIAGTRYLYLI
jgi:uncharacterized protein YegL